jgi:ER-derived vesicles protein
MVMSDSFARRRLNFAGLPELRDPSAKTKHYFQLAGRVLLILLFFAFLFRGEKYTWPRIAVTATGILACALVVIGFKAKYSAVVLVAILSVFNVLVNDFWGVPRSHPHRDFLQYHTPPFSVSDGIFRYDFFQTLSIIGGFVLLVNMGPGGLSVDEKKSE